MKTNVITTQAKRHRKVLLLPVLVLPFLTLLFWSMKAKDDAGPKAEVIPGLNTHLPGAKLKDEPGLDKMSFYEQADQASRKRQEQQQQDPYAKAAKDSGKTANRPAYPAANTDAFSSPSAADANEKKIYDRLTRLRQVMARPSDPVAAQEPKQRSDPPQVSAAPKNGEDPELRQMSNIMDKLIQLQHPEAVKPETARTAGVSTRFRAFRAVIDGTQKITENTVVKMKLLDSATIGGQFFPAGQPVFAAGYFSSQRMKIDIRSIHIANMIYPVDLTVFDANDGLEGISMPEALTGDALRSGANGGLQNLDLMSFDPSVQAQLATAGVNTAKSLFSKKIKRIKARLDDQRAVLLRDNSEAKK
jgi:hypothetical protein